MIESGSCACALEKMESSRSCKLLTCTLPMGRLPTAWMCFLLSMLLALTSTPPPSSKGSSFLRNLTLLSSLEAYMNGPVSQKEPAPGLAYFHIPLPEYASFDSSNFTGVKQEGISSASVNSGFFTTLVEAGDVKAVFTGHDHVNDFCGKLTGIHLCYAGGFGYHAYGKAGWSRRARVVLVSLEKTDNGRWEDVKSIKTWKRLDDQNLTGIDGQVLWSKSFGSKISLDSGILGATAGKNKMMALKNLHDAENMLVA
ncbi:putative inactive purple acid phosphatase 29 [Glycine max]|nr:putative inactive purple acid phosphatase 29 [Glycine max]